MKKTKIVLIFLSGLLSGGIGGYILALKKPIHEKIFVSPSKELIKEFKEGFDKGCKEYLKTEDDNHNEVNDILDKQYSEYIDMSSLKNHKTKDDKNDSKIENDNRKDSDNFRLYACRDYISNIVQPTTYDSKSDASKDIEGELHLVKESDISDEKLKPSFVKIVGSVDFVKAIAKGALLRSFIFNTLNKQFYWNFTEDLLSIEEAEDIMSKEVVEEILHESDYNPNGWIQTRYLYNVTYDFYIKIEAHSIVPKS